MIMFVVTEEVFEAFLNCETKASLILAHEGEPRTELDQSQRRFDEDYRQTGSKRLLADLHEDQSFVGSPAIEDLKSGKYQIVIGWRVEAQGVNAYIHALQRIIPARKSNHNTYIPIRFTHSEKIKETEKLLLAFDAVVLSKALNQVPSFGKIMHGKNYQIVKVNLEALIKVVLVAIERIAEQARASPPQLTLNKHCVACGFQARCRQVALEKDDLSLLASMTQKERMNQHAKGIFTVTQLSYTYRPRKRLKQSNPNAIKDDHALKALAIREGRIYVSGRPELEIGQQAVYLDVEGLPDQDFYYLIGLRIRCGDSYIRRSLWANDITEEKAIWHDLLGTLLKIEQPQIIHYGAYETVFFRRMKQRYAEDELISRSVDELIASSVNLLSVTHAQIYFPTYSNGLKDVATYLGFQWSEPTPTGLASIAWRHEWESSRDPGLKKKLLTYNAEDCEALERVAETVAAICCGQGEARESNDSRVVHTNAVKVKNSYRFGVNEFSMPELNYINRCAYWDYQRDRIYIRSEKRLKGLSKATGDGGQRVFPINKTLECALDTSCPKCHSDRILKYGRMTKVVHDIKFGESGVKRWVVKHSFNRYLCSRCRATFVSQHRPGVNPKNETTT